MTFTAVTEDVIIQEGTFAFDYDASGTVYKGQGVYAVGTQQVKAPAATVEDNQIGCVGVCLYGTTDGKPVAVAGPGNICRVRVSGTATTAGDALYLVGDGEFSSNDGTARTVTWAHRSGLIAIALETKATDSSECKVLLF